MKTICVIGMGFIGTTLAAVLAEAGFEVLGIEQDLVKLEKLQQSKPHFYEKGLEEILTAQNGKNLHLYEKIPSDKNIDAFIVAVATPVNDDKKPNLEYVKKAVVDIVPCLKDGQLVILRSTVPVGTSRNFVLPLLKRSGRNVLLSFCPERTVEGKAIEELKTLPQIIGGLNEESVKLSEELFSKITPTIVKTSSLETAEIIKLVNNSYRDFSFAFANQIALIAKNVGLDAKEVIMAANEGYVRSNILQPGFVGGSKPGFVGGVCLEKDPYILLDLVDSSKIEGSLIKAVRAINEALPQQVFESARTHHKSLENAKVFISGLAFKGHPETDDLRGSPALRLLNILKENNVKNIFGHDFVVKEEVIRGLGLTPCSLEEGMKGAGVAIFMNNHKKYNDIDIKSLVSTVAKGALVYDGWQLFDEKLKDVSYIAYESIGFKRRGLSANSGQAV